MSGPQPISVMLEEVPDGYGQNLFEADPDLMPLLALYLEAGLLAHLKPHFHRLGGAAGGRLETLAATADREIPKLVVRTRNGTATNQIIYHPAYVEMEKLGFSEFGLAAASHVPGVLGWHAPLPHLAKYTLFYLFGQAEHGLTCPLNMTDSFTRTLKKYADPSLVERYFPKLTSQDMDQLYQGAMFMTEQRAGSDISLTETMARRDGKMWRLYGDKWFCSNTSADLIMVLARPDAAPAGMAGVTLFLMPRIKADGTPNDYRIIALKDKLGTRSMATGEVRLEGAEAYLIGEIGRGFQQIVEMVTSSRLSNGVRSAALMRRALTEATYLAQHRHAFGKLLEELPLMRLQLSKMTLLTEQARSFAFQAADALQRADAGDMQAKRVVRIMTPLVKYRACRDARKVTADAMEVRAGSGFVNEWTEPRLMRDSFSGTIGEGTSNIVALDVYRAIQRQDALSAYSAHLQTRLDEVIDGDLKTVLKQRMDTVIPFAKENALNKRDEQARDTSSALYQLGCAVIFAWEASHAGLAHRSQLARSVLTHRLDPILHRVLGPHSTTAPASAI